MKHPARPAAFWCGRCQELACDGCVEERRYATTRVPVHTECGDMARPWTAPTRSHPGTESPALRPFWARPGELLLYPLQKSGLIMLAIWGGWFFCFNLLSRQVGGIAVAVLFIVSYGAFYSYCFMLMREAAAGRDDVPAPQDFRTVFEDIAAPLGRLVVGAAPLWLPAIITTIREQSGRFSPTSLTDHGWVTAIAVYGVLVFPMATMMAAHGHRLIELLNPVYLIGYAVRIGGSYVFALVYYLVLIALATFLWWLFNVRLASFSITLSSSGVSASYGLGFPWSLLADIVLVYPQFVIFRMLGVVLREAEERLDPGG